MKTIYTLIALFTSVSLFAQDKIEFEAGFVYPEGVAYNPKSKTFYISSVRTGQIGSVDAGGNYKVFFADSTLKSTFGMKVDSKRNRLWVCAGDPTYSKFSDSSTYKKMSKLISIDLASGKIAASIDLSSLYKGKHFPNDLALDDKGNIYITDSFSPVIYKVDVKGKASVFAENELFKSKDVGLNGIVWHPSGYLLTVNNSDGFIIKIDAKNPANVTRVKAKQFFPGADGLLLDKQSNLILIQGKGVNKVFTLSSKDQFASAEVISTTGGERFQNPTTAAFMNDQVYVLNAKLNELQDSTRNPSTKFSIQLAKFGK